jgi:uncharacterized membrane protein YgaE (UPF0421/DUF939 family)
MKASSLVAGLQLSLRAAVAAGLAMAVTAWLGLPYPIYALVAAVIVSDLSPLQTRQLGLLRMAGSALGAAVGALLCGAATPGEWAIAAAILPAMLLSHLLGLTGAAKLAGYVCGIVMLNHSGAPWTYAWHRLAETAIGIAAAMLVSYVPRLVRMEEPAGWGPGESR